MDTKSTTTNILSSRIDPKKTAELVARLRKCTLRKGFADDLAYVAVSSSYCPCADMIEGVSREEGREGREGEGGGEAARH